MLELISLLIVVAGGIALWTIIWLLSKAIDLINILVERRDKNEA